MADAQQNVTYVPEDAFRRAVPQEVSSPAAVKFLELLQNKLSKCKFTSAHDAPSGPSGFQRSSAPPRDAHYPNRRGAAGGGYGGHAHNRHGTHSQLHLQEKHGHRVALSVVTGPRATVGGLGGLGGLGGPRATVGGLGGPRATVGGLGGPRLTAKTATVTGLLNRLTPENADSMAPLVLRAARSQGAATIATHVCEHAIKQPSYMQLFVRLLRDLVDVSAQEVSEVVAAKISAHASCPFLHDLLHLDSTPDPATDSTPDPAKLPDSTHDAFCARNKAIATLRARVLFATSCIKAGLVVGYTLREYASVVCENLRSATTRADLEVLLLVVHDFVIKTKTNAVASFVREGFKPLMRQFERAGLVSTRAKCLAMDVSDLLS